MINIYNTLLDNNIDITDDDDIDRLIGILQKKSNQNRYATSNFLKPKTKGVILITRRNSNRLTRKQEFRLRKYYESNNFTDILWRQERKRRFHGSYARDVNLNIRKRAFTLTRTTIANKRLNTFIDIRKDKIFRTRRHNKKVVAKFSCGLVGYKGPKKSTSFARKEVVKEASIFLANNSVYVLAIAFATKIQRHQKRKIIKELLSKNLYMVSSLTLAYMRAHGFLRYKKKKRL